MIIQIFMAVVAVVCTAAVAKYIWQERGCFKAVYDDMKQELKQKYNKWKKQSQNVNTPIGSYSYLSAERGITCTSKKDYIMKTRSRQNVHGKTKSCTVGPDSTSSS